MTIENNQPISISGLPVGFMNFEGAVQKELPSGHIKGRFNRDGARDFVIFLEPQLAHMMEVDGFNVKWPKPKDDIEPQEDTRQPYLGITVTRNGSQPVSPFLKVFLVDQFGVETLMDNSTLAMLDDMFISHADVIINPYLWNVNGQTGAKAYLKSARFHLMPQAEIDARIGQKPVDFTTNYGV